MTSILVVCTGNICRSPIAEGLLRDASAARFGDGAARRVLGRHERVGGLSRRCRNRCIAAAERGVDIAGHVARAPHDRDAEAPTWSWAWRANTARPSMRTDPEAAPERSR